jgi:hypothetical protein
MQFFTLDNRFLSTERHLLRPDGQWLVFIDNDVGIILNGGMAPHKVNWKIFFKRTEENCVVE